LSTKPIEITGARIAEIGGTGMRILDWIPGRGFLAATPDKYDFLLKSAEEVVSQIGVGMPLEISHIVISVAGKNDGRTIVQSPNIPWLNKYPIVTQLEKKYPGIVIRIINDMISAALGMNEQFRRQFKNVACTTNSSGTNTVILQAGLIVLAKEFGHFTIDPSVNAPICACGGRGHAEAIISGNAVSRNVRFICECRGLDCGDNPCKFLDEQFDLRQEWAEELYSRVAYAMGCQLALMITMFDIDGWVVKGTFGINMLERAGLIDQILRHARAQLMPALEHELDGFPIVAYRGKFQDEDAFIGALRYIEAI
jgi:predicted NBD/HSP70 family sugar kinase